MSNKEEEDFGFVSQQSSQLDHLLDRLRRLENRVDMIINKGELIRDNWINEFEKIYHKEMKGFVEQSKEYEETLQNMKEFLEYYHSRY